jgi:ferredoxin
MDQLDAVFGVTEHSRLACQILTASDLDGLEIRLAPGSEID